MAPFIQKTEQNYHLEDASPASFLFLRSTHNNTSAFSKYPLESEFVFKIVLTIQSALAMVHKVCDAAGLPHRTVHSLRHTNITMQIAAGVPLVTVAGRAGHARTSTTTDIYSHFLKSSDKTAAEKLEQLFE